MLEALKEHFHRKPEILTDDELLGQIDSCLRDYDDLVRVMDMHVKGKISSDEMSLYEDRSATSQNYLGATLSNLGLWEKAKGKNFPSMDEIKAVRDLLDPPQDLEQTNVISMEQYRSSQNG